MYKRRYVRVPRVASSKRGTAMELQKRWMGSAARYESTALEEAVVRAV